MVELDGDEAEASLLLILDGLDELAKQGHTGAQLAQQLTDKVARKLGNSNIAKLRLRVLLCGRPIAVQGVESGYFSKRGQVLHLLPYCVTGEEQEQHDIEWTDREGLLKEDQRKAWWRRYGACTGRGYVELPEALSGEALIETTRQPLLGYLLALVYEDALAQGKEFSKHISRNDIYERLIEQVHARDWGKPGGGHSLLGGLDEQDFFELLEDMALAAWHDGERVTSVAALARLPGGPALAEHVREHAGVTGGIGQLFAAFYMRRQGHRSGGEETFEFTHKSFAEYLTARRLVAQLELAAKDLQAQKQAKSGRRGQAAGKTMSGVLLEWLQICGPTAISADLLPYLRKEVALRNAAQEGRAKTWQAALIQLIEHILVEGMPCEQVEPRLPFIVAREWARNAEEALLALLWCCAEAGGERSKIAWPERNSFATWFSRLVIGPTGFGDDSVIVRSCLGRLDLRQQVCTGLNFWGANLEGADLQGADLVYTNLQGTNLEGADLQGVKLTYADLEGANLRGVNLTHANLRGVKLTYADLTYANLICVDLQDASLQGVNLQGVNLQGVNLEGARLQGADLTYANLRGVNLHGANLQGAYIEHDQLARFKGISEGQPIFPDDPNRGAP